MFQPFDAGVPARFVLGAVEALGQRLVKYLDHQAGLAGAADAGDTDQLAQREAHIQPLQVVLADAAYDDFLAVAQPPRFGNRYLQRAAEILAGQRVGTSQHILQRAAAHHLAAVLARARTQVYDPVSRADGVLVVFDHQHRVAQVA